MQLNREVLPAPLGPTNPRMVPADTARLTQSSTWTPPKRSDTSWTERCGGVSVSSSTTSGISACAPASHGGPDQAKPLPSGVDVAYLKVASEPGHRRNVTSVRPRGPYRRTSNDVDECVVPSSRGYTRRALPS